MSSQKGEDLIPAEENSPGQDGTESSPLAPRPDLLAQAETTTPRRLADWQLPAGVDRPLWDYLSDTGIAQEYDTGLAQSSLFRVDVAFVERHCPVTGQLVDLGCGTGRLLIPLAKRGNWVLGVDLSRPMLAVAQQRARAAEV